MYLWRCQWQQDVCCLMIPIGSAGGSRDVSARAFGGRDDSARALHCSDLHMEGGGRDVRSLDYNNDQGGESLDSTTSTMTRVVRASIRLHQHWHSLTNHSQFCFHKFI
jgi:hypothetical protein